MPLSLHERQAVVRSERSQILDQIQSLCQYGRGYAARALRTASASAIGPGRPRPGRGRKTQYGSDAEAALIRCWAILNFPTSKRVQLFCRIWWPSWSILANSRSTPRSATNSSP